MTRPERDLPRSERDATPAERRIDSTLTDLVPALVADLPGLLDEVQRLLGPVSPDYARFLAQSRDELASAAEVAMVRLVEHAEQCLSAAEPTTGAEPDIVWSLFEEVGRTQWREGLPLVTLLSAYQVGGRAAWRHMSATALRCGIAPRSLAALAESVFFLVDQLSSASTEGYLAEQSAEAAAREHLRDVLAELLLSDRSDSGAVRAAATRAGWRLPVTASVIYVDPHDEVARARLARLEPSCLAVRHAGLPGAIIPDPGAPGRRQRLATSLRGSSAVIGAAVPLEQLPASARIAEIAAHLQRHSLLEEDLLFVDDHLDTIIVHRDPRLLDALRRQCLAPLDKAVPTSRDMLRQTLRSWLLHMGDRRLIAEELRVHPQTVRYRLARLHELFGPVLVDPAGRLRLLLALAWEQAGPSPGSGGTAE